MAKFRLDSLNVENFRSISGSWTIPLDAQVVLVHGPNGAGKTSLLSAIELAATGGVSFLDGQSDELHDVLLNRNYPLGSVHLRLRSADATTRSGSITLDGGGLTGMGALDEAEQIYFRERCFLPQTALGRLLETYTATGEQVDTALVRFVKTVVGLDDLDSLIEGLRPAGHVARARAASAGWEAADADCAATQESRKRLQARLAQSEQEMTQAAVALRALLSNGVEDIADGDLPQYVSARHHGSDPDPAERTRYESLRVRLEGVVAAYTESLGAGKSSLDSAAQAETAYRATAAYNNWETGDGALALTQLNNIRAEAFALPGVSAAQIFDGFEDAQVRAREVIRRRSAARERRVEAENLRSRLTTELDGLTADVKRLEAAAAAIDVPADVRVLLDLLEKTIPLVMSDVCPICDQRFAEDGISLRQHLEVKAGSLSRGAQELMHAHDTLQNRRIEASRVAAELESITIPNEDDAPPEWLVRKLNSLDENINVGFARLKEVERTEARKAEATSHKASREVANRNLASIRDELGIDDIGLQISEETERLAGTIEERSQASLYELNRRGKEVATSRVLEERMQQVTALRSQLAALDEEISALQTTIKEANARKKAANELRLDAERIRSSVINHVFDKTLNTLWADLFSRFVPSEPFVPRFRKQKQAKRTVDIHLETVLPTGEISGAPSAMLSYGNTNTAALSLFIALHLSAPTELPWLIFDDPVQSMDDIHVANFATVVRQLSYAHDRQVVIAVHQQELFEYLALELAPATPGESLLKVSLNRRGDASYIQTERVEHHPEPSLTRQGTSAPDEE
jgi:DNA repair protein SbcC/Rad50